MIWLFFSRQVFSGEHIQSITEKVKSEYPYSYSYLHGDRIQFDRNINRYAKSPCTGVLTYISGLCIILRCGLQGSKENFLECAHFKCNALLLNSIECTTCVGVFAPSIKKVLRNCIVFTPAFNLPGLLVLSKVPLRNNMYTQFNSEFKVLPRFYLTSNVNNFIKANYFLLLHLKPMDQIIYHGRYRTNNIINHYCNKMFMDYKCDNW